MPISRRTWHNRNMPSCGYYILALHGAMGENGQLQAYLDCCGIKYTGSSYAGCLFAMDKDIAKKW